MAASSSATAFTVSRIWSGVCSEVRKKRRREARSGTAGANQRIRDPFGLFNEGKGRRPQMEPRARKLKTLEAKAFDTLGLSANATTEDIKSAYKTLVKKHHPDANGGDRGSEERFRAVIQAYQLLKQAGFC